MRGENKPEYNKIISRWWDCGSYSQVYINYFAILTPPPKKGLLELVVPFQKGYFSPWKHKNSLSLMDLSSICFRSFSGPYHLHHGLLLICSPGISFPKGFPSFISFWNAFSSFINLCCFMGGASYSPSQTLRWHCPEMVTKHRPNYWSTSTTFKFPRQAITKGAPPGLTWGVPGSSSM